MKRIQIERKKGSPRQPPCEPLPLDPRDPLVRRAKQIARIKSAGQTNRKGEKK